MQVRGPVFAEVFTLFVNIVTQRRDIVRQRVKPNVNNVLFVKRNGNAPFERRSRNAEILKPRVEEVVYHFLFAEFGADEVGVVFDVRHKPVRVFGHLEEVRFFFHLFDRSAAVGALAVHYLRFREKRFARLAVPALVFRFVYVALLVEFFEDILNGFFVIVVGRSDKVIVTCSDKIPYSLYLLRNAIHERFRRKSRVMGFVFYFLPVFVRSRAEENVKSRKSFVARNGVGQDYFVSVSYMRFARSVGDSRCYIVRFLFSHFISTPCYFCE